MLDKNIVKLACERTQLEIKEQWDQLRKELNRIKTEMAVQGALGSGATLVRITDLCAQSIKSRAQLVWSTMYRFVTTAGINYSNELSTELKTLVAGQLPEELDDFKGYIKNTIKILNAPKTAEKLLDQLVDARKHALNKVETEIDLFVHSLKKKTEQSETGSEFAIFNIYSPAGSVQTIDEELKQNLIKTLDVMKFGISQHKDSLIYPKNEVVELIQDCRSELEKETSNITKLRSFLTTIGTSVHTIHSMKPVYDMFRQEVTSLGISLP